MKPMSRSQKSMTLTFFVYSLCALGGFALLASAQAQASVADSTVFANFISADMASACLGTGSDRSGFSICVLSADSTELSIHIEHDINPSNVVAAHIHSAPECTNGSVVYSFGALTSPIVEVWTLSPTALQDLLDGKLYINIHTVANANGEIRGQIAQEAIRFSFTLDESQIDIIGFDRTFSHSNGVALCELNATADEFRMRLCHDVVPPFFSGLHIHTGPAGGEVGPVAFFVVDPASPVDATWDFEKADLINLFTKNFYLNLHSNLHIDGEIRGQIQQEELRFVLGLDGAQAHAGAGSASDYKGFAILTLNKDGDEVSIYIEHDIPLDSVTTGEIRLGLPGEPGAGIHAFSAMANPIIETWPIIASEFENLIAGELYVSIQSMGHFTGEIRGQIPGVTDTSLTKYYPSCDVTIDADQAVACAGSGSLHTASGFVQLKKGGRQFNISVLHDIPIDSIQSGHLHVGPECAIGGVAFGFTQAESPIKEIWYLAESDIIDLMRGQLYINLHTTEFPAGAGELRGQILKNQGCCNLPGDGNDSGDLTIGDVTFLIARIFTGGPPPVCCENADSDGSGSITIGDVTYLIARIFTGGQVPQCGPVGMTCGD
ncbi:CHRD domain-containing protein [Gemmatimonas aurantiaca]|nr:CHRD domain-containing protein [Gemmatimonas aurantiaca]